MPPTFGGTQLISRRNPMPEGYRFWIWPEYRLETPNVCVMVNGVKGKLLAALIGRMGRPVPHDDLLGGPLPTKRQAGAKRVLASQISGLKSYLRQYGVVLTLEPYKLHRYVLRGISACEPEPGVYRERWTPKRSSAGWPIRPVAAFRVPATDPSRQRIAGGIEAFGPLAYCWKTGA